MMNPALRSTAANTFQHGPPSAVVPTGHQHLCARNSSGVGAVRSLAGRSGTAAGISSGTAKTALN